MKNTELDPSLLWEIDYIQKQPNENFLLSKEYTQQAVVLRYLLKDIASKFPDIKITSKIHKGNTLHKVISFSGKIKGEIWIYLFKDMEISPYRVIPGFLIENFLHYEQGAHKQIIESPISTLHNELTLLKAKYPNLYPSISASLIDHRR